MTEPEAAGSPQESKADKFKRLAESRVNNAIAKISLIGNLASSDYEFTKDQVDKILAGLRQSVDEVEKKFQKGLNRQGFNDEGRFKL
ncbi:MAG TPA: hypothetical protein VL404_01700 [Candidatus Eisenbacteria bacterium]|nr:hypothetical protein [Candidatus Eisenbacteria bacterium]